MTADRQVELLSDAMWQAVVILGGEGFFTDRRNRARDTLQAGLQMAGLPTHDPERWHREPEYPPRGDEVYE